MDMNRSFNLRKEDRKPKWRVIDAEGKVLGRLATEITDILRGKDKPTFTPHTDSGDYVIVVNAAKVVLTGNKVDQKEYLRYSGWIGGIKSTTPKELLKTYPDRIITAAVKGMLPTNKLKNDFLRKLRIFAGPEHDHKAQVTKKVYKPRQTKSVESKPSEEKSE